MDSVGGGGEDVGGLLQRPGRPVAQPHIRPVADDPGGDGREEGQGAVGERQREEQVAVGVPVKISIRISRIL